MRGDHEQSSDGDAGRDPEVLEDLRAALVWEADAWAIHVTLVTHSDASILGFSAAEFDAEAGFLKNHVHPDDWPALLDTMYRAAADGGVHSCTHRMRRGDESTMWAQTSVNRSPRSNGSLRLTGVTINVDPLVQRNEELRLAEEGYRLLVENLRDYAIFMVAPDGTVATWNAGAHKIERYDAAEIVGSQMSCFFPDDEIERGTPERLLTTARIDREAAYEGWLVRKGGATFWGSVTLTAIIDARGQLRGFSNVSQDLSERRRTEQALRESESRHRRLVESVVDYAVFQLSPDGHVQSWNRGAQRLEGYREHEILGASMSLFWPPEQLEIDTPARMRSEAAINGIATYEGWLVRKDGSKFWAMCTLSVVEDEAGRLRGFSNVARDLTEKKHAEDAMRESEQQLRLLIDSLQDYGVFMIDADGQITSWSRGAQRLEGYTAEAVIGRHFDMFLPPQEIAADTTRRLLDRAAREGRAEYEGWIVRASGSQFWATNVFNAVRDADGNLRGFSAVARDLTERMRAERAQTFLADVGSVLAHSLDLQTTCDAICRMAIREIADWCVLLRRRDSDVEPIGMAHVDADNEPFLRSAAGSVPADAEIMDAVKRVVQTGKSELVSDIVTMRGGATVPNHPAPQPDRCNASYICVPLHGRGTIFGAIVLGAAPTERFSTTDLQLAEELADRAALALENARLFDESQRAIRLREEVLAVVTHDLRSPLSSIQMGADSLVGRNPDIAMCTSMAVRIKRATQRMSQMISDLLDFSSIEAGKLRLELAPHDVAEVAIEAIDTLEPQATEKHLRIEREIAGSGVMIRCDRNRLIQVFTNLLSNAIKFTDEGGTVVIRSETKDGQAVYSIGDTGPGIDPEDLPHIFERYWQASGVSRDGGVGLGLAISKGIVQSHGGSIWVESTLGQGTTFHVAIPVAKRG